MKNRSKMKTFFKSNCQFDSIMITNEITENHHSNEIGFIHFEKYFYANMCFIYIHT